MAKTISRINLLSAFIALCFIFSQTAEAQMADAQIAAKIDEYVNAAAKIDHFLLKVVDAQVTFIKDDKGNVTSLILHQDGRDLPGRKTKKIRRL